MNVWIILLIIFGVILFGLAVLFLESYRELHRFRVKEYRLTLPGNPKGKVLFLSDYHEAVNGKMNDRLISKAKELAPDLILIGGDMVNGKTAEEDIRPALGLINGLADVAPVYYAFGNHEKRMIEHSDGDGYHWDVYERELDPRVHCLVNESTEFGLPGGKVRIAGLDMAHPYFRRKGDALTKEAVEGYLGKAKKDLPLILLAHDPSWGKVYEAWGADLTLAGHYHGGVIRLPLIGGFISPKFALFPHYDYGYYKDGDGKMLVTNGLGQHTIPVRFCNIPEMVLVLFE